MNRIHFYNLLLICILFTQIACTDSNNNSPAPVQVEIRNDKDSIISAILPDSSSIYLGRGSVINYSEEEGGERNVTLQGEARFEVKKNEVKKFNVYAGNTKTMVVGTVFHVRAYPDEENVVLNVVEGEVAFSETEKDQKTKGTPLKVKKQEIAVYQSKRKKFNKRKARKNAQDKWMKDSDNFLKELGKGLKNLGEELKDLFEN